MPWSSVINPDTTIVIAMEVVTEELCTSAVKSAPIKTRRKWFLKKARKFFIASSSAKSPIASLIIESPTKSMPKPAKIPPILRVISFFANARINAPMPAKAEKITEVETLFSPNRPIATS